MEVAMTPLVAVRSSTSLTYRAIELEQMQKKNMMIALAISIAIHAFIVASYYLFPTPAIDLTGVDWKPGPHVPWADPEFTFETYDLPTGLNRAVPGVTNVKAGRIVVVPEALANPTDTFATQNQLHNGIVLNGDPNGEIGEGGEQNGSVTWSGSPRVEIDEKPLEFWAVERKPEIVKRVVPEYPVLLQKAGLEGKVFVRILVDKEGKPSDCTVMKSDNDLFSESAIEAAKQFVFTPGYMNSGPVRVWVSVPFKFKLADRP